MGGRADNAHAQSITLFCRFMTQNQRGKGQIAQVAPQSGIHNLQTAGQHPGADVVAGFGQRAGLLVRTGRENVQFQFREREGAQIAQIIASGAQQRLGDNHPPAGGQGARGAQEQFPTRRGGQFVEDIVNQNDIGAGGLRQIILQRRATGAQLRLRPAGAFLRREKVVHGAQRGSRVVARVQHNGPRAEIIQHGPRCRASAAAEVQNPQRGCAGGRKRRQFGKNVRQACVGLRGEIKRISRAITGVAQIQRGCFGFAGAVERKAVGQPLNVRQHAPQGVAVGQAFGFLARHRQPVGFQFGGINNRAHIRTLRLPRNAHSRRAQKGRGHHRQKGFRAVWHRPKWRRCGWRTISERPQSRRAQSAHACGRKQ